MLDLSVLNPPQREAVVYGDGPLLVLAGAGSGKTRVLTYRIARLIENGVAPWRILAITFTNKAAREMVERVARLSGEAGSQAWVSTFHSCCARILRRDIDKLGYKREFAIYDEDDRMTVIKGVAKALGLNDKEFPPKLIKSIISDAKNKMLSPREWLREAGNDFKNAKLCEAYEIYEKTLKGNNALDFDDLLLKTLELLTENPPTLAYYKDRFDYILVDEYQDTNMAQYEFIRLLTGEKRNLCVVGDDDQSIYGWRGADVRNILEFEKDFPDAKVVKLEQNYRSTGNILDAANQVIAHNEGRKEKALWTESGAGDKIALYDAMDERDEAAYVATTVRRLGKDGFAPGQIAVLYRTNAQSRVLEEAFVRTGLSYRVYGGLKFYDRKEVKDLIAYMRALVNPDDDVSTRRIINEPKRGVGDATVDALAAYAAENDMPLLSAAIDCASVPLSARAKTCVAQFGELMVDLTEAIFTMQPSEFLQTVIDRTGYVRALDASKDEESETRKENIQELQGAVAEYEKSNPEGGVTGFLENVALVTDIDGMPENGGAVTLMTLHSAKGLEFDCVFLVGLEEGIFPITRAVFDDNELEEERRLCYVGITRAKQRLFMSHARTRMLYNSRRADPLSRFVGEIPSRLITNAFVGRMRVQPSAGGRVREQSAPFDSAAKAPGKLGIPGLTKGFGSRTESASVIFEEGDRVKHSMFGLGTVLELVGSGAAQRARIRFDSGTEKIFAVNAAPISKVI